MDMRMMGQCLSPGMQDDEKPDLGAKMLWIGGERRECLGCRTHQQRINQRLVLESDLRSAWGQSEDHMEIWNWQQFALPRVQPSLPGCCLALRAVSVTAAIISDTGRAAGFACLDMTAENGGAANLDRAHDAPFDAAEVTGVITAISIAMATEDLSYLEGRCRGHHLPGSIRRSDLQGKALQRALGGCDQARRNTCIARGRRQVLMTEQNLDDANIGSVLKKMRRKAVT